MPVEHLWGASSESSPPESFSAEVSQSLHKLRPPAEIVFQHFKRFASFFQHALTVLPQVRNEKGRKARRNETKTEANNSISSKRIEEEEARRRRRRSKKWRRRKKKRKQQEQEEEEASKQAARTRLL